MQQTTSPVLFAMVLLVGCAHDGGATPSSGAPYAGVATPCDVARVEKTAKDLEDRSYPNAAELAYAASQPRGVGATGAASIQAARLASARDNPAQAASLLAYARHGLRDNASWAELGLAEADAWVAADQRDAAGIVLVEVWRDLGNRRQLHHPPRETRLRHQTLMALWDIDPDGSHGWLPTFGDQTEHLQRLGERGMDRAAAALTDRWHKIGWVTSAERVVARREVRRLRRPRRKRSPSRLRKDLVTSSNLELLAQAIRADNALVTATVDTDQGLALLEEAIDSAPNHPQELEWRLEATRLAVWQGDTLAARRHARMLRRRGEPHQVADALWYLALANLVVGELDKADELLHEDSGARGRRCNVSIELCGRDPRARALYWRGRIAGQKGQTELAVGHFQAVGKRFPFGYYHVLAADRLRAMGRVERLELPERPDSSATAMLVSTTPADTFRLDVGDRSSIALSSIRDQLAYTAPKAGRRDTLMAAVWEAVDVGEAIWLAYNHPVVTTVDHDPGFDGTLLRFDRPGFSSAAPVIRRVAYKTGFDAEWLLALIRQESGFVTTACSFSGACGWMQLKPETARAMAREAGIPFASDEDLYDPETNLALGTYFLRKLEERYQHDPLRALAAYNGGPGKLRRWGFERAIPSDLFVELYPDRRAAAYAIGVVVRYGLFSTLLDEGELRTIIPDDAPPLGAWSP